jgi:hypothetical protein
MKKLTLIFTLLVSTVTFALPVLSYSKGDIWACTKVIEGNMRDYNNIVASRDNSPKKLIWTSKTTFRLDMRSYENVTLYSKSRQKQDKTRHYIGTLGIGSIFMTDLPEKSGVKLLILNEPQTYNLKFESMRIRWYHCSTY